MADIDAILQRPAREFYEEIATPSERAQLDDIIALVRLDPTPDGEIKFPFDLRVRGMEGRIYYDGWFWLIYRMLNNWTVSILNIGFEDETPSPKR